VRSNEKGFILVTILLVIAVLFPLILAFNAKVQLNLIQAENFLNSVQALRIARSGVEGAKGILKADDASYDAKTDKWAAAFPSLALGDGILNVVVVDEDGKIPINNLIVAVKNNQAAAGPNAAGGATPATTTPAASGTASATTTTPATGGATPATTTPAAGGATPATTTPAASGAASATTTTPAAGNAAGTATGNVVTYQVDKDLDTRLRSLISQLGGKPEIVDALIDWLDPDNDTTGSDGAEDDYYKQQGYRCKNGPLDSLDELLLVRGFDNELLTDKNLKSYLTIAPTDGKVNLNTAPIQVLYAVLGTQTSNLAQPMSQSTIQDLVRYRDEHDLKNVTDMTSAVKISQDQASAVTPLVKVNSAFFTVNSRYTIGNVVKNVEALLKRSGTTVTTISWRDF
jgi:type II secretory pathway component PulK